VGGSQSDAVIAGRLANTKGWLQETVPNQRTAIPEKAASKGSGFGVLMRSAIRFLKQLRRGQRRGIGSAVAIVPIHSLASAKTHPVAASSEEGSALTMLGRARVCTVAATATSTTAGARIDHANQGRYLLGYLLRRQHWLRR